MRKITQIKHAGIWMLISAESMNITQYIARCRLSNLNEGIGNGSDIAYAAREIYTRNWHMQCPVEFKPINKEGFQKTLQVLNRVKNMANELEVETSIDNIIFAVEDRRVRFNVVS